MTRRCRAFYFLMLLGAGCSSPAIPEPVEPSWFVDCTERAGLSFVHDPGPPGRYFMPAIMGSGAALLDIDNDGRLDIYLVQNAGPGSQAVNRLYHQEPDGTFRDVSAGSGLDVAGYGMGVAVGDVDNDGWPDVVVTEYRALRLFHNQGNGRFTEITGPAGLDMPTWATSAAFLDYNRDGWLDLVVASYVDYDPTKPCHGAGGRQDFCGPHGFNGTVARLFRNCGPGKQPRFEDVTVSSGLGKLPGPGLGVLCADFDGDRWPDILIANDGKPNHLWINHHDGTFREEAALRGLAFNLMGHAEANMGIAIGDSEGRGLFDVYVTHLDIETNTVWRQGPRGIFQDRTASVGLGTPIRATGFGTVLADFNHDGTPEIALVNGKVRRAPEADTGSTDFWQPYAEHAQLLQNDGKGRFVDVSARETQLCGPACVSRGLACGDIDNDGALDLLVCNTAAPARLYRNVAPAQGHWLTVRAVDPALKRDAYGAEVLIRAGKRQWLGWINPGYSYLCSNDPRAHFGLGQADRVDGIEVVWPDGKAEAFPGLAADQQVVLRKGEGRAVDGSPRRQP